MSEPLTDGERRAYAAKAQRDVQKHRQAVMGVGNVIRVLSQRILRYEETLRVKDATIAALVTAIGKLMAEAEDPGTLSYSDAYMNLQAAIKEATP